MLQQTLACHRMHDKLGNDKEHGNGLNTCSRSAQAAGRCPDSWLNCKYISVDCKQHDQLSLQQPTNRIRHVGKSTCSNYMLAAHTTMLQHVGYAVVCMCLRSCSLLLDMFRHNMIAACTQWNPQANQATACKTRDATHAAELAPCWWQSASQVVAPQLQGLQLHHKRQQSQV